MQFVLYIVLFAAVAAAKISYEGYKTYDVYSQTENEENILNHFYGRKGFDFWGGLKRTGLKSTVMVSPKWQNYFLYVMNYHNIKFKTIINNVENAIQRERHNLRIIKNTHETKLDWSNYNSHQDINDYLNQLVTIYPDVVSAETIGQSYEGRDMIAIKIGTSFSAEKPGILIEGGIHAREWISPAVVTYIVQELVENPDNRELVENLNWFILPVHNPDGYEYTRTDDRMWRKTRKPGELCVGTDPNRNFDYMWMYDGASDDECSEIFAGNAPFSEPETEQFSRFALANSNKTELYLAFHSYGQVLLYPWGYGRDIPLPDNWEELQTVGEIFADALKSYNGTEYRVGNSVLLGGPAAGATDDWCKSIGITLSYTVELPGGGDQGFDLPTERILPVARETFLGVKAAANYIINKYRA